ncbi:response regulator transcription factor [Pseudonocardia sp. WMMC193]|jgi:DNA-binding response OmpR family regulator|uniref:response regulator transcription factor n=1 Tax=Pseudonocardia sp. WMMC193 TaxID=2911965 RepID=UPI001F261CA1|nr:response regulator transcription factor [Pseudonocardia sp. WMMC193]MCF7547581.1 response regulator transcription factor [Pseudonocardia sp. WMMC193]
MARLLLVEDDDTIGHALSSSLAAHGHEIAWHTRGRDALAEAARGPLDLVLLDLGLPDLDGVAVCRGLRAAQPDAVVVMLTARAEEMDVIIGLEAGADDYLTKPVRLAELHARVRAHLRRRAPATPGGPPALGDLALDTAARRVTVGGTEVTLRTKEYELLARLAAEPGVAVSRETLMSEVWDEHWFGSTKTLDVHVAALRRRLAEAGGSARLPTIVTLRGHGYRLDPP